MKTVFFELENWEKEYIQAQLALRSLGEVGLKILVLISLNQPYCLIIITPSAQNCATYPCFYQNK